MGEEAVRDIIEFEKAPTNRVFGVFFGAERCRVPEIES